jgi:hypothetical protein
MLAVLSKARQINGAFGILKVWSDLQAREACAQHVRGRLRLDGKIDLVTGISIAQRAQATCAQAASGDQHSHDRNAHESFSL